MNSSQRIYINMELREQRLNTIAKSLGRENVTKKDVKLESELFSADIDNYITDDELAWRFFGL